MLCVLKHINNQNLLLLCVLKHINNQSLLLLCVLKHINNQSLLLPYEQYHIQALHHNRKLIPEQSPGDTNPLFQMVINP